MKKVICAIILVVLTAIFAASTYLYISGYLQDKKQMNEFENIAQVVDDNEQNLNNKYAELYSQNNDFIGRLKIDGTGIDYPVMQSRNNPNYYLKHNFNKEYSRFGVPYMQEDCNLQSDNIVIYGHNMKNKSMFNELTRYKNKDFYNAHKYITFETMSESRTYEIIATFKTVAYSENGFKYYNFVNANTEEEYETYIEKCRSLSFYDTGVDAEYSDKLITLSTCEYSQNNGRFVVVAKLIEVK